MWVPHHFESQTNWIQISLNVFHGLSGLKLFAKLSVEDKESPLVRKELNINSMRLLDYIYLHVHLCTELLIEIFINLV